MGSADGVSRSRACAGSFAPLRFAQDDRENVRMTKEGRVLCAQRPVWFACFSKQIFHQLSEPSSGMTASIAVMATSIIESSGSNTVRCWIISPGQRSARDTTLSDRPA